MVVITATDKKITFPVSSGLLDKNHYANIGTAIWEFMWLIDRVTEESLEPDGQRWGKVLGGKVISADEIAETFGSSDRTVKRNLDKLEQNGYIRTKRFPRGKAIDVRKSIKWLMRFHGDSTAANEQKSESGSPFNQLPELVAQYRKISGVVAQERDYGAIGKLCKEFGIEKVADGFAKLQKAVKASANIKDPLNYLSGIIRQTKADKEADEKKKFECPKCHGKGTYIVEVPFNNGLDTKLQSVTCECRQKKPSWYKEASG